MERGSSENWVGEKAVQKIVEEGGWQVYRVILVDWFIYLDCL